MDGRPARQCVVAVVDEVERAVNETCTRIDLEQSEAVSERAVGVAIVGVEPREVIEMAERLVNLDVPI